MFEKLFSFLRSKAFFLFLSLINFAAAFFSLTYYWPAVVENPFLWFLLADCPFYAFLFGLNLFLIVRGKGSASLTLITIVGNFKYGLWTIFVLASLGQMGSLWWFVASHLLLILQTLVLIGLFRFTIKNVLIATVWFALNDFIDYVLGFRPLFDEKILLTTAIFALASSIILPLVLSVLFSSRVEKARVEKKSKIKFRWAHPGKKP